jgi:hypothetical protein
MSQRPKVDLGQAPTDRHAHIETYEVTAEWDEEDGCVYVMDWDPYDGRHVGWIGLYPSQMDRLVAWWQEQRTHIPHEPKETTE